MAERLGIGRPGDRLGQDDGQGNRKVTAAHTAASLQAGSDGAAASSLGRSAFSRALASPRFYVLVKCTSSPNSARNSAMEGAAPALSGPSP